MLYHLVLLSLTALTSAVAPFNGFLRIIDFEGRSVDLHNTSPVDYDPIQSYNSTVGDVAQKWLFNSTTGGNPWRISNAATGTFASYTTAPIGGDPQRSQVCAHPNPITFWSFSPNGAGFNIQEAGSGLALTAWPFQPTLPLPTSPLTLELLNTTLGRQVFTLASYRMMLTGLLVVV
ncbi:hypothetical protein B0H19DRAFT_1072748 [Mycena capillaripes]|nr:hypothetical protein B0H19DRAFT_1072748 [Mycena capillaripes]